MKLQINGSTFEVVGERDAISEYGVGDRVKLLRPKSSYDPSPEVVKGWIVSIDAFTKPTITILLVKDGYMTVDVEIVHFNSDSKNIEIGRLCEDEIESQKEEVIQALERQEKSLLTQLTALKEKRDYVMGKYAQVVFGHRGGELARGTGAGGLPAELALPVPDAGPRTIVNNVVEATS